jgi:hypothetical protein
MNNSTHIFVEQTRKEAACYSLPYGGIGFASHFITHYTMAVVICGHQPLRPWRKLKHRSWDIGLAMVQLTTTILTSIVIHKCHDEWPFMLIAVWMLTTSMCVSAVNIAGPLIARGQTKGLFVAILVGVVWICGCVTGCVGLITIVLNHDQINHQFYLVSCVFGGIVFAGVLIGWCMCCAGEKENGCLIAILWPLIGCCTLGLFWMDWSLGTILGNLAGVPSESAAPIFWSYIIVKRLGLLSI